MKVWFLFASLIAVLAYSNTKVSDPDGWWKFYQLSSDFQNADTSKVTIAILDTDVGPAPQKEIPGVELVETYSSDFKKSHGVDPEMKLNPFDRTTGHGAVLSKVVQTFAKQSPVKILNANGYSNFLLAVNYAVEVIRPQIILYAQNWECCGNYDGQGYINDVVNLATDQGIIWINAVGNYAGRVYQGPVQGFPGNGLEVGSVDGPVPVAIYLAWNSGLERVDAGTDKDLDIEVVDPKQKDPQTGQPLIVSPASQGHLRQVFKITKDGETNVAREFVHVTLSEKNAYRIKVLQHSGNFDSSDYLRVTVVPLQEDRSYFQDAQGNFVSNIKFPSATPGQTIFPPSDNPNVVAVGSMIPELNSGETRSNPPLFKPDIIMPRAEISLVDSHDGGPGKPAPYTYMMSSMAAAVNAGIVAVLKSARSDLTADQVKRMVTKLNYSLSNDPNYEDWGTLDQWTLERVLKLPADNQHWAELKRLKAFYGSSARLFNHKNSQGHAAPRFVVEVPALNEALMNKFSNFDWRGKGSAAGTYNFYFAFRSYPRDAEQFYRRFHQKPPSPYVVPFSDSYDDDASIPSNVPDVFRVFPFFAERDGVQPWDARGEDPRAEQYVQVRPLPNPFNVNSLKEPFNGRIWKTPSKQELNNL